MATESGVQRYPRRLMIREMTLENFKSYAGPQHVGPFHKCFSSVVGPNGSGKSNVIDAMLFVFGRRAKQLRFNKVSELIHNSTNHRNLDQARVIVYFQEIIDKEGDDYEVVPGTEFTVTRTANRNNTSDYYINNKRVTTKEVTTLLKEKGIDLDNNRFLILQGEVEQISLMKPKAEDKNETGLLEYLEDIIDTAKYIEPIEQESKKLEEVNERRQAMINKLRIVEKDKEQLEGKKLEAEAYIAKKSECIKHKIMGNKINIYQTQVNIQEMDVMTADLAAKLQSEKEKFKKFDQELKEHDKKYQAAEAEVAKVQTALDEANEKFKEFERKDVKLRADLKHLKNKLKNATSKLVADKKTIEKLEADIERLQEEIPQDKEQADKTAEELQKQDQVLEGMQESIKGEVEQLHQQLSKVRQDLSPWEAKMQEAQNSINIATTERDMLTRRQRDAEAALQQALQQLEAAKQGAKDKEKRIAGIKEAIAASRHAAEQARRDVDTCQGQEQQLEVVLQELRAKVQMLRGDLQSQQTQTGTMAAISEAMARGELTGVHGRLGDLGAIDAKYDVAICTACGALDYLVVETTSDAQRVVEFLRRNRLGVVTCLILDKQRYMARHMAERVKPPEDALRLFDLVKPRDEDIRLAFYWALRNTLVAKDLEQATRIAYGSDRRFQRIVTVDGALIAESGTMSGGGGKPRGGRICLGKAAPRAVDTKAAAAELERAERELQQQAAAHQQVRAKSDAAAAALKQEEAKLARLEADLPRAEMELAADKQKAKDLQQRLQELQAATEVSGEEASRVSELEKSIKAGEKKLADLNKGASALQQQAAQLQQQIDNAGGEKLKKQKALVAKLGKLLEELEGSSTKKAVQVKNSQKQLDKLRKDISKQEGEQERTEASIKSANEEFAEMERQALKVAQLIETTKEEMAEREEALAAVRADKQLKQKELGVMLNVQMGLEANLDTLKAKRAVQEAKVKVDEKEVAVLVGKLKELTDEPLPEPTDEQLASGDSELCLRKASYLDEAMRTMNPDLAAMEEYRKKEQEYNDKHAEMKAVTEERDAVRQQYDKLRKQRLDEFMEGFNVISMKLKEMYQMITLGGDAELELVDSLDPFSEGIVFSVRPPKKSWKNISNLSGGEKTLSSLSLVFALHHYKPTPLYVMDEIDAALDFKNVSIVGHYIKEQTKNAQFIIISLRNNMFELADRLHGIYKTDNCTKTVTINPSEFVVGGAKQQQQQQEQRQQQEQEQRQEPQQQQQKSGIAAPGRENRAVELS